MPGGIGQPVPARSKKLFMRCGMREFVMELWAFMNERKKFLFLPIILVLMLFSILMVLTQGSALAPFVYTLF
jgi:hypothetical protein